MSGGRIPSWRETISQELRGSESVHVVANETTSWSPELGERFSELRQEGRFRVGIR